MRVLKQDSQCGMGMLEIMVVVSVMSIMIAGFMQFMSADITHQAQNISKNDVIDLRNYIQTSYDCPQTQGTIRTNECTTTDRYIDIKRGDGSIVVPKFNMSATPPAKQVGKYYIRARCADCVTGDPGCNLGKRIVGDYIKVSQYTYSAAWKPLYTRVPFTCPVPP